MRRSWDEDFEEGDSLVPFADFGTVVFSDASAKTSSGATVTLADADPIILVSESDEALTTVSFPSTSDGSPISPFKYKLSFPESHHPRDLHTEPPRFERN